MAPVTYPEDTEAGSDSENQSGDRVFQTQLSGSSGIGSSDSQRSSASEIDSQSNGDGEWALCRILKQIGDLLHSKRDKATQTFRDPTESDAERLALDIVYHLLGKKALKAEDTVSECLRHCVGEMLSKHSIFFTGMMNRLDIGPETDLCARFDVVANELFEGGTVTWGRIVALYAFGGRLAIYCKEHYMEEDVLDIARHLGNFARSRVVPFVKDNGGWTTLEDVFPCHEDVEGKIWNGLLFAAGIGLGLAGTLSFLAVKS